MRKLSLTLLTLLFFITGCTIDYSDFKSNKNSTSIAKNSDGTYTKNFYDSSCNNIDVYYLDLKDDENKTKIGDSTYIKCGNIDILIDAGVKNVGSNTVVPFLKEKVTDKKIELTIITHTDNDHIGGFVGLSSKEGALSIEGFTYEYILESGYSASTQVYNDLQELISNSNAKVCNGYESLNGINECVKSFKLNTAVLEIIDTSFYNNNKASSNNRSIVTTLTHNNVNFLFPGDLEDDEFVATKIGHIDIFKASHHGASSANSQSLLNAITPNVIILSADGKSYDIPQQESIDRIYSVTNEVYATFITGTIKITSDGNTYSITCDNKTLLQNSEWFKANRHLN